jgi:phosphoribosyl-AMP cyclohydrolase
VGKIRVPTAAPGVAVAKRSVRASVAAAGSSLCKVTGLAPKAPAFLTFLPAFCFFQDRKNKHGQQHYSEAPSWGGADFWDRSFGLTTAQRINFFIILKPPGRYVNQIIFEDISGMQTIDFEKGKGLVPVIVQDYRSRDVLMVAYMDRNAWEKTKKTGKAHYYSRSRQGPWLKGEESGNFQEVKEAYIDCDQDTLLLQVRQVGGAACHKGYRSCFFRKRKNGRWTLSAKRIFDPKEVYSK